MLKLVRIRCFRNVTTSEEETMISQLIQKIQKTKAPICVGLDPMLGYIPNHIVQRAFKDFGETMEGAAEAVWQFNKEIIDNTYDLIPSVKPQIAMYEQFGIEGLKIYARTIEYCQNKGLLVIGDVKRGDIGSTSSAYAVGHIGSVKVGSNVCRGFNTDFITVNPYLGTDGIKPFVNVCNDEDRGLFVLVKTSNPSSGEFQDRLVDGRPLYELVAEKVVEWGEASMDGDYSNVGAVVGATYPEMSKILRKLMPKTYFLVPGYGAQGGTAKDLMHCFNEDGLGAVVNSSRGIIAAYKQEKYAKFGPEHPVDEHDLSGSHAADMLGVDHGSVFKTLVLKGERTGFLVCCIPVDGEVDLKKAAKAAGDKKVEMLPMKDLLATTGYIRGGCSPIGMKKKFPTFIDEAALNYETIAVSAGQRGFQVLLSPQALADYVGAKLLDLQQN